MAHDRYISPFSTRYASDEMQYTFSDDNKFRTWRRLWIALAKAEQKQGLDITDEQIAELEAHKDDINYEEAIAREKLVRHDVMSHVYAYGLQCPKAKGIIHLGATSCYVGDNTDVIIMREGLQLVRKKLIGVLANLADFAEQYKDMPCLAYTHCQPAQLTTVGIAGDQGFELRLDEQERFLILLFIELHAFFLTHFTQGCQHIIVYDELLIKRFELLVLVGQFLSVSFDKLHGEFDNGAFGYQVAVIIRVKSGVDRHEIIRHDTASAVNGTAEFLGLYFQ